MGSAAWRAVGLLAAAVVAAPSLAACTSKNGGPTSSPSTTVRTRTVTQTRPASNPPSGPISTGPTRSATAASCPLLTTESAALRVGMRLGRITVLSSAGQVVGCRLYAQQQPDAQCDATCLADEKLPPAGQPAVEITTTRYPSPRAAHNGFVIAAGKARNAQTPRIGSELGVCFQTAFYDRDAGQDWACSFRVGSTAVLVKTVVRKVALNVELVSREVAARL